jgi:hypothetical protein
MSGYLNKRPALNFVSFSDLLADPTITMIRFFKDTNTVLAVDNVAKKSDDDSSDHGDDHSTLFLEDLENYKNF